MRRRDFPMAFLATASSSALIACSGPSPVTRANSAPPLADSPSRTGMTQSSDPVPAVESVPTTAETAASVTPTNYAYPPGDLRRYAAFTSGGGDVTAAFANACAQAEEVGGSPVYIPAAMGALTITAGVTISKSITVYGDGRERSVISTASDITVFTLYQQGGAAGCTFRDFQLLGQGNDVAGTHPAFQVNGSPYNSWERTRVQGFAYGIYFATAGYSCYLNSITDSEIDMSYVTNIYCEAQTHQLAMQKVTFGSAYTGPALYITDSCGLSIIGGDCEGNMGPVAIDIDNSIPDYVNGGHIISGVDFEKNSVSIGEIRIGNTHNVHGVCIFGCAFSWGSPTPHVLVANNAVNCVFYGNRIDSGYDDGILSLDQSNTVGFKAFSNDGTPGTLSNADALFNQAQVLSQISTNESGGAGTAINCSLGNQFIFTVMDTAPFAINGPSNATAGQRITITIRNASGGTLSGIAWNSVFKMADWTNPAKNCNRSIDFQYDGTNWTEVARTVSDVPN